MAIIWNRIRRIDTLVRIFLALCTITAFAAACGGGGSGDGTPAVPATVRVRKTPSRPCQVYNADIDGDGAVSIFDVTQVTSHFGETVPPAPAAVDQDGDKTITILDVNLVESVFLQHTDDCP